MLNVIAAQMLTARWGRTLHCIVVDKSLSAISGTVSAAGAASAGVAGVAAAAKAEASAKAEPSGSAFTPEAFVESSAPVPSEGLSRLGAVHKTHYARNAQ